MFCEVCGKENNQFVKKCSYCGGKLIEQKPLNPDAAYKKLEKEIIEKELKLEQSYLNIDMDKEIPEYGPWQYNRNSFDEIESYRPKYKHYIDLYAKTSNITTYVYYLLTFIIMVSAFAGFYFLATMDSIGVDTKKYLIFGISSFVIMVIGVIGFFINDHFVRKDKNEVSDAILSLMLGNARPGKIKQKYKEEKKNETLYFIVFRYAFNGITYETTQRVKNETYVKMYVGDSIEILMSGLFGIIDEYPNKKDEFLKRTHNRRLYNIFKNRNNNKN